eukprot:scaffold68_cov340-Pavlova_lutheri.AAC.53
MAAMVGPPTYPAPMQHIFVPSIVSPGSCSFSACFHRTASLQCASVRICSFECPLPSILRSPDRYLSRDLDTFVAHPPPRPGVCASHRSRVEGEETVGDLPGCKGSIGATLPGLEGTGTRVTGWDGWEDARGDEQGPSGSVKRTIIHGWDGVTSPCSLVAVQESLQP